MEATNDIRKVISNMVKLVMEREITWESLESILVDMSSTLAKSKQVIKVLIHELKVFDEKCLNGVVENDINSIGIDALEAENIVTKPYDCNEEVPIVEHSDKPMMEDFEEDNDCERKTFEIIENDISNDSETDESNESLSGDNDKVVEELENEFYVFIGDKNETNAKREAHEINEPTKKIQNSTNAFECSICFKNVTTKHNLKLHRRIHTQEKPFQCKSCSRYFARLHTLKKHEMIHTGEKPFKCKTCSKYFTVSSNLIRHERIHTGEKPFQCQECGKYFRHKSALCVHERIHTGEKPYECKHCQKCFGRKGHLKAHERIHTGEKPYRCKYCQKSFANQGSSMKHERIHTKEKPYNCETCRKSFTESGQLKRHKKTHTRKEPL